MQDPALHALIYSTYRANDLARDSLLSVRPRSVRSQQSIPRAAEPRSKAQQKCGDRPAHRRDQRKAWVVKWTGGKVENGASNRFSTTAVLSYWARAVAAVGRDRCLRAVDRVRGLRCRAKLFTEPPTSDW